MAFLGHWSTESIKLNTGLEWSQTHGTGCLSQEGVESSENRQRRISIPELPVSSSPAVGGGSRRSSIPALPSAEEAKPRRRVRILDLPYREPPAQPSHST